MNKKRFILRTKEAKETCLDWIRWNCLGKEPMEVTVKPYKPNRSLAQNDLYWLWVGILSKEIGYTKEEMHDVLRVRFLEMLFKTAGDVNWQEPKSTTDLTTKEFAEYLHSIEAWALSEGYRLPHPDDYKYAMLGGRE